MLLNPQLREKLDPSGAAEADAHPAVFHQHRDPPVALGEALHLLQGLGILEDVTINDL